LLSTGAPASRRNAVNPFQWRRKYVIALPRPELGLDEMLCELRFQPFVQRLHHRLAVVLVEH
jgi:hypothetical protein